VTPAARSAEAQRARLVFGLLALLMLATRTDHFGTLVRVPDASLAVFFLGGIYVRQHLAFAVLAALAFAIDLIVTSQSGTSASCITPAYGFLLPAYAAPWYVGRAIAPSYASRAASLRRASALALVATTVSFVISNGSFYWLGGAYASPNVAQYLADAWRWGPSFVLPALAYVGVAFALQGVADATTRVRARGTVRH
jgi:hypothetical protein